MIGDKWGNVLKRELVGLVGDAHVLDDEYGQTASSLATYNRTT